MSGFEQWPTGTILDGLVDEDFRGTYAEGGVLPEGTRMTVDSECPCAVLKPQVE